MLSLDRNNTNFQAQLLEFLKNKTWESKYDFLKYYQNIVRCYLNDVTVDSRGLLIYHTMGVGKSMEAIAIAVDMIKERQPIILLTKSLKENMRNTIFKYVKLRREKDPDFYLCRMSYPDLEAWINKNFSFVSMNASNMLKQMGKAAEADVAGELDAILEKKFGEILKIPSLEGKLLIVDEAHNLFRAITNGSKNAIGLYDLVMKSKNLKVVFLTGTPVANDPFELVPCFNMLGSRRPNVITLPDLYKDFYRYFVHGDGSIKNKAKFQNRLMGLVSHITHKSTPGAARNGITGVASKVEFPTELPTVVEKVSMDPEQYIVYLLARDKELEEGKRGGPGGRQIETPSLQKPKSKSASSYRVRSRQISNWCPPAGMRNQPNNDPSKIPTDALESPKYKKMLDNITAHKNQIGVVYSQFVGTGGLGTFSRYLELNGWEELKITTKKNSASAATAKQLLLAQSAPGEEGELDEYISDARPRSYVEGAGPELDPEKYLQRIEKELEKLGGDSVEAEPTGEPTEETDISNEIVDTHDGATTQLHQYDRGRASLMYDSDRASTMYKSSGKLRFAIISGAVDIEDRTRIQDIFNSEENRHGGILDLILLSSTGAEGLDLKNVRHIHIMEPYWNYGRIAQIKARGIRNDSHIMLPPEEKNVQPYVYLSVPPATEAQKPTTDVELYDESVKNQVSIDSFTHALEEISIECSLNNGANCRVCNPSDIPLYSDNINKDIETADPCSELREKKLMVKSVEYNGTTYYYAENPNSVYDYSVYVLDANINNYRPMKENNPLFEHIIEAITARA